MTGIRGALAVAALFFAAPVIWLLLQQSAGVLVYLDCRAARPPFAAIASALATAACAIAALGGWRRAQSGPETRRFLMRVGAGSAAIFALAALIITVAFLLEPACAR